jgi:predicted LPLAT superfamily acyltransferase
LAERIVTETAPAQWKRRPEGGGRFALWLIRTFAQRCGRGAARLVLLPITLYFLIRRGPERRASRAYLTRVFRRPARLIEVARHIHCFAATIIDRVYLLSERFRRFDIRVFGVEPVHALMDRGGVLLLGSHLGSFEALRVLSLQRPSAKVRVVLDVGHNPAITTLLNALNPEIARTVIDAGQDGTAIVLAIKEALDEGALVTLLADRVHLGEQSVPAQFLGERADFPASPWLIASILKVPVALCFGLYLGGNRYDLHFEVFSEVLRIDRRQRQQELALWVQRYADRLEHYLRIAPYNWFNFYDFWKPVHADDGAVERRNQLANNGRTDL